MNLDTQKTKQTKVSPTKKSATKGNKEDLKKLLTANKVSEAKM